MNNNSFHWLQYCLCRNIPDIYLWLAFQILFKSLKGDGTFQDSYC